ncbi:MAG: cupin domain-containing protein [Thermomicrobiales bacterium]
MGVPGTESTGMVYFEIEPGNELGLHTDSPDELLVILSGTARATIGDEVADLSAGSVAFVEHGAARLQERRRRTTALSRNLPRFERRFNLRIPAPALGHQDHQLSTGRGRRIA